ncbi:MAG: two-component system LytT family sensor kinase [Candidatus Azotimanducaceae bacterium]|jgi:two-component system LytT family sensor kinase
MNPIMRYFSLETYSMLFQQKNFQFWGLQFLGWAGWVTLFFIRDVYWGQAFERIFLLIIDACAGFLLTTALRYFYQAIWERPVTVRIIGILAGSYLVAVIWQPAKNVAQFIFYNDFRAVEEYGYSAYFNGLFGYSYFLILGWSGLYFGMKFYRLLQEEQQRSIRAESMAHEAQLRMLRYQLNPHFLFNTLNAISTLILEQNTTVANQMVSKLSNFLRYSLDKDPMQKVDLDHEISTMKLYLEIEQVRFEDRLKVELNVTEDAAKALVPSLILQPLVENSIKYAIASRIEGGTITINAKKYAGDLLIEVIDDGPGLDIKPGSVPAFGGVGIVNTLERLAELYGDSHSCKFLPALPHGLQIEIRLPYERL